jgi:hypothetical protein
VAASGRIFDCIHRPFFGERTIGAGAPIFVAPTGSEDDLVPGTYHRFLFTRLLDVDRCFG